MQIVPIRLRLNARDTAGGEVVVLPLLPVAGLPVLVSSPEANFRPTLGGVSGTPVIRKSPARFTGPVPSALGLPAARHRSRSWCRRCRCWCR